MVLHRTLKARARRLSSRNSAAQANLGLHFTLDRHGWLKPHPAVARTPSPNFDARAPDQDAYLLVIHNISLPPGQFGSSHIIDFFQNQLDHRSHPWLPHLKGLCVSAHFLIRRTGHVVQFVSTHQRAWHAGISQFEGRERCNDFSIGIELEGTDTQPYETAQYDALCVLGQALRDHHPIRAVRGHEHIAPKRKTDPGPSFDWGRFAREGKWPRRQLPDYSDTVPSSN